MNYRIGQPSSSTSLDTWIPPSFFSVQPSPERIGPLGLEVGTGGYATFEYFTTRGDRGYWSAPFEWSHRFTEAIIGTTVTEKLARIREVLGPTMIDLAALLRVSRRAVYDWQEGKEITAENLQRVEGLAKAADVLAVEGLRGSSSALHRPIKNGKTFFQLVKQGGSAEDAARSLVRMLRVEADQREGLQKRLAGRKRRPSREIVEDFGVPTLNEQER
jgi:transcriptional regulator with XRE-family HTH domain